MMKVIGNLKTEFNKTIETSKRTQAEMKMKLNNSINQNPTQGKTLKVQ